MVTFRLPSLKGLNEWLSAFAISPQYGAAMKRAQMNLIMQNIKEQKVEHVDSPVWVHFNFYEKSRRRDKDNISATAHKFVLDALVKVGVLDNDTWKIIAGYTDTFKIDANDPRIEVSIEHVEKGGKSTDANDN